MNIHHLELFYYVARHRGVLAACRHIPYGIQQPAVSLQVIALEKDLGTTLFQRRPFELTSAGQVLFDAIAPFFSRLPEMRSLVTGQISRHLRLAGATEFLRDHLPSMLREMGEGFHFQLCEASQSQAQDLIEKRMADLALTVIESSLPPGFHTHEIARLPLIIWLPTSSPIRTLTQLRKAASRGLPLIGFPAQERIMHLFREGWEAEAPAWQPSIETTSLDLIAHYVREGLGAGVAVAVPRARPIAGVRALTLRAFPPLPVGVFWKGTLQESASLFLQKLEKRTHTLPVKPSTTCTH